MMQVRSGGLESSGVFRDVKQRTAEREDSREAEHSKEGSSA